MEPDRPISLATYIRSTLVFQSHFSLSPSLQLRSQASCSFLRVASLTGDGALHSLPRTLPPEPLSLPSTVARTTSPSRARRRARPLPPKHGGAPSPSEPDGALLPHSRWRRREDGSGQWRRREAGSDRWWPTEADAPWAVDLRRGHVPTRRRRTWI
jgi:hypothetical protein